MKRSAILEKLLSILPSLHNHHSPCSSLYGLLKDIARRECVDIFRSAAQDPVGFIPFGDLVFPYHAMGETVDTTNLFDLDELVIFSFYWTNRNRYRRVVDAGANLGLHSILLSKCGYSVRAYEPDPQHYVLLQENLDLNGCTDVLAFNEAVSSADGELEFVKVVGNTTSSHLTGAKEHPYGQLERFAVKVGAIHPLLAWADLVKMDVEGHEMEVLLATSSDDWATTDALVEVENGRNAAAIFRHFNSLGIGLFSQKRNWCRVRCEEHMPTSYHEGSLFITSNDKMPWPS